MHEFMRAVKVPLSQRPSMGLDCAQGPPVGSNGMELHDTVSRGSAGMLCLLLCFFVLRNKNWYELRAASAVAWRWAPVAPASA